MKDITELNFLQTVADIPNRLITLVWKLMSVKGLALAASIYLIKSGSIGGWESVVLLVFVVIMVIGGREADKWKRYLIDIRKASNSLTTEVNQEVIGK